MAESIIAVANMAIFREERPALAVFQLGASKLTQHGVDIV